MIAPNPDGENTRGIPESYREEGVPQHSGAFVPLEASFILWHDSPSWR
jgi:hypothetical protein